jgi:uncharacterized protein YndB with AHSA1/START domain
MPEPIGASKLEPGQRGYELVLEKLLPASPERVFDAWINPDKLAKW